jgi:hypothetical protein
MGNGQTITFEPTLRETPVAFVPGATPRGYYGYWTGQQLTWVDQPQMDNWPGIFVLQAGGSELRIVARHVVADTIMDILAVKITGRPPPDEIFRYIKRYCNRLHGNGLADNRAIFEYIQTGIINGDNVPLHRLEEEWEIQIRTHELPPAQPVEDHERPLAQPVENHELPPAQPVEDHELPPAQPVEDHELPPAQPVEDHELPLAQPVEDHELSPAQPVETPSSAS